MGVWLTVAAVVLGFGAAFVASRVLMAYRVYRGPRVCACPDDGTPAAVRLYAWHAALTALRGRPALRVAACSHWPELEHCDRACLVGIEQAPEASRPRTILARWYERKSCVLCGHSVSEIHTLEHKPCLMAPDGTTIEWGDIPPERLPSALATHAPVCWNCHVAETFRQEHPELVVERPRHEQETPALADGTRQARE